MRYGHKWTSVIDELETIAVDEWSEVLAGLTAEQIKHGFDVWKRDWPPSSVEFRRACLGGGGVAPLADRLYKALPKPALSAERRAEISVKLRDLADKHRSAVVSNSDQVPVDFKSDPARRAEIKQEFRELGYVFGDGDQANNQPAKAARR